MQGAAGPKLCIWIARDERRALLLRYLEVCIEVPGFVHAVMTNSIYLCGSPVELIDQIDKLGARCPDIWVEVARALRDRHILPLAAPWRRVIECQRRSHHVARLVGPSSELLDGLQLLSLPVGAPASHSAMPTLEKLLQDWIAAWRDALRVLCRQLGSKQATTMLCDQRQLLRTLLIALTGRQHELTTLPSRAEDLAARLMAAAFPDDAPLPSIDRAALKRLFASFDGLLVALPLPGQCMATLFDMLPWNAKVLRAPGATSFGPCSNACAASRRKLACTACSCGRARCRRRRVCTPRSPACSIS